MRVGWVRVEGSIVVGCGGLLLVGAFGWGVYPEWSGGSRTLVLLFSFLFSRIVMRGCVRAGLRAGSGARS